MEGDVLSNDALLISIPRNILTLCLYNPRLGRGSGAGDFLDESKKVLIQKLKENPIHTSSVTCPARSCSCSSSLRGAPFSAGGAAAGILKQYKHSMSTSSSLF